MLVGGNLYNKEKRLMINKKTYKQKKASIRYGCYLPKRDKIFVL